MKLVLKIFFIVVLVTADQFDTWSDVVEKFYWFSKSQEDIQWEFSIIGKRATWHEAKALCSSKNVEKSRPLENSTRENKKLIGASELAILDREDLRLWFSRMLSESNYRYDSLWIGAFRENSTSNWTWIESHLREDINNETSLISELSRFPYWKKKIKILMKEPLKNCLTFDRMGHNLPGLVPIDCHVKQPFLCSKIVPKKAPRVIKQSTNVTVDGIQYSIFSVDEDNEKFTNSRSGVQRLNGGGISWIDARLECRKRGQYLAILMNNEVIKKIGSAMMKNRPSMENVWIGGRSLNGTDWKWSSADYALLPSIRSPVSQYPPWLTGHPIERAKLGGYYEKYERCLVLDRHLCPDEMIPVFLDLDCTKKRPFVCQNALPHENFTKNIDESAKRILTVDGEVFEFSPEIMTWDEGRTYCERNNSKIADVLETEILSAVINGMTELKLDHIWVGGRTERTERGWRWIGEDGKALSREGIGMKISWCLSNETRLPEAEPDNCLNLDREGRGLPLFYGLRCDSVKQHVLCRLSNSTRKAKDYTTKNQKLEILESNQTETSTQPQIRVMSESSESTKKSENKILPEVADVEKKAKILRKLKDKGYNTSESQLDT